MRGNAVRVSCARADTGLDLSLALLVVVNVLLTSSPSTNFRTGHRSGSKINMTDTIESTTSEMPVVRTDVPALKMSGQYTHGRALEDLPGVAHALALFMASHMIESEQYCHESDPKKCV